LPIELDYMEYATDAAARSAYPSSETEKKAHYLDAGCNGIHTIGDAGGLDYWYCVRIVLSKNWRITGAAFHINTKTGNPGGPFYIRLETDSAGHPSGTLVHANASGSIASPVVGAWNRVNFTPFSLGAGTYYLKCNVPDQPNNNSWDICRVDPATGRRGWSTNHGASWSMYDNAYIPYHRVYGEVLQCFSSTTRVQGSYSLLAIAEATDSLNDTLTRVVTPTVNLSDLTKIKFSIRASRTGSNIKILIRDSGGTWSEYTANVTVANSWQTKEWNISGVSNANKNAIDRIQIKIVNAGADNTFYLDNMFANWWTKTFSEQIVLSDSFSRTWNLHRTFIETLTLTDTIDVYRMFHKVFTETLVLSDTLKKKVGKVFTENINLSDLFSRRWNIYRTYTETINLADTVAKKAAKTFKETLILSDFLVKKAGKVFSETLTLTDSVKKKAGKVFSETLNLTDSISKKIAKTFTETLHLTDTFSRIATYYRTFTETIHLTDTIKAAKVNLVNLIKKLIQLMDIRRW